MQKYIINSLLLLVAVFGATAQTYAQEDEKPTSPPPAAPIPLEVVFGGDGFTSQIIIDKKIKPESRFGFFGLSFLNADYDNKGDFQESNTIAMAKVEIIKQVSFLAGATYQSFIGFRPYTAGQLLLVNKNAMCNLVAGFYLSEVPSQETMAMIEYHPKIKGGLSLYTKAQALLNINIETGEHDRSYVFGRAGVAIKNFSFGAALNYDWYGPLKVEDHRLGIFLGVLL